MPLTPTFDWDVFISYCHDDNVDAMGKGWIELFAEALNVRLVQLLGARTPDEEPRIWRDPSLQGNEDFANVLSDKLRESALVVSVMSPSYVRSEWCKREIEEFCQAASETGGVVVGDHKWRLLKVLKDPVPREDHPEVFKVATGYPFYTMDPARRVPISFTLTRGDETIALAKRVIDDLAYSIIDTLKAVRETVVEAAPVAAAASPAAAAAPEAVAGTVYLAESDLDEARQQVRRALEAHGITVLPAGELPLRKPDEFKQAVRQALERCDLALHMVGPARSTVLRGEDEDIVYLQNDIAADISAGSGMARLIWLPPELEVEPGDARQQAFVDSLHRDPAVQRGAEVLTVPLQALIARVQETLKKRLEARERPARAATEGDLPLQVYLITDMVDTVGVDPLRQYLVDQGFDVLERLSDDSATPEEKQADHRQNLVDCDAALVYVGAAGENWTKTLLSEIQKANGWRDPADPLRWRAIWLAPPASPFKVKYLRKLGFDCFDGREAAAPALLQPFLDGIRAGEGA